MTKASKTLTGTSGQKSTLIRKTSDGGAMIRSHTDGQTRWFSAAQIRKFFK
jgi:hypothetical protein